MASLTYEDIIQVAKEIELEERKINILYKGLSSWSDSEYSIDKEGLSLLFDETLDLYKQLDIIQVKHKKKKYRMTVDEFLSLRDDVKFVDNMYQLLKSKSDKKALNSVKKDTIKMLEKVNMILFFNKSGYRTKEEEVKYTTEI